MDLFDKLAFKGPLFYGVFSMTVYILIVFVILSDPTFKSTFYNLLVIGFIMNLLTYLNSFITCRIPQNTGRNGTFSTFFRSHDRNQTAPWFPVRISHTLHYNFAYSQYFHSLLICLDRLLALLFLSGRTKYRKRFICLSIFVLFILPAGFNYPVLTGTSFYIYNEHGDFFYIDSTYSRRQMYEVLGPFLGSIASASVLLILFAIYQMRKVNSERCNQLKSKMLQMAMCTLTIEMFLVVLSGLNWYLWVMSSIEENPVLTERVFSLIPFASDALTLTPPYLILVFNKTVREKCVAKLFRLEKKQVNRMLCDTVGVAVVERIESVY